MDEDQPPEPEENSFAARLRKLSRLYRNGHERQIEETGMTR
jgi:hypothetical protein